ncbi:MULTISPECIES: pentapeptide repeat-containing protein [Mumia]|uniref:pentapeptide repeat-containing protein n=1 Tax=Mumia TaxID=1546255 RepID=UPI001420DFEF|nr:MULTISPECIES: pentapeptide repeat-containing protein [unclassified Mumia]QMW66363.1 pentapeptide repeat-containing protein [Mumia sp. ZJ1417]
MGPKRPTTRAPQLDTLAVDALVEGSVDDLVASANLDGLAFVGLTLDSANLSGAQVRESLLERVNVAVLRAPRATLRDVRIEGGRIGSADLYDGVWESVRVSGCKLSFVNLRGAQLRDVVFTDCVIDELDLVQATAVRVSFAGCTIARLDVQHTKSTHVDLRGAELREIVGVSSLRGVTITPLQLSLLAPLLADSLGITVED